jgi:hypothetical protein
MSQQYRYPNQNAGSITILSEGATGAAVPADALQVGGKDGSGNLRALSVDSSGILNVSASSLPLPTGAATAAKQDTGNTSLASIDTKTPSLGQALMAASSPVVIASNQSTLPVSAASLPLPSGAATEVTLSAINGKTPALGQALMAASVPVTIASNQSPMALGAAEATGLGTFDNVALTNQTAGTDGFGNQINTLAVYDYNSGVSSGFDSTMSNGSGDLFLPTPPGTDTILISVDGTWTGSITAEMDLGANSLNMSFRALNTGTLSSSITANGIYAVENVNAGYITFVNSVATGTANVLASASIFLKNSGVWSRQAGTWNITNVSGTVSLPTGASTSANQTTGNSSLSSIDGKLGSLGQKAMTGSAPVVIASDQSTLPTNEAAAATATCTNVNGNASSVSLLASNSSRKGAMFFNDSTAVLYLKFGTTASTTSYTVQIPSNGYYEMPGPKIYSGAIDGIWSAANGAVRITELT